MQIFINTPKQLTRIIVPFAYDNYQHAFQNINQAYWSAKDLKTNRLFTHIEKLVSSQKNPCTISTRFVLQQKGRRAYSLPQNHNHLLRFHVNKTKHYDLSISNVELYLFETDIGFLIYEIDYGENMNLAQIIDANYHLKKFYDKDRFFTYKFKESKDSSVMKTVRLDQLTTNLLNDFNVKTYFDASKKNLPFHALVFNAVLIDDPIVRSGKGEHIITEYLFRMRRSFEESYKPNKLVYDKINNPEIVQIFENNYWGISLEGCANIVYLVGDPKTDHFFQENYFPQIRSTYFYMYILALHQRYALLHYSILTLKLPISTIIDENSDVSLQRQINIYTNDARLVSRLKENIVLFKLRSVFKQVSNLTHRSAVYELFRSNLKIDELMVDLQSELESLSLMIELKEKKAKQLQTEEYQQQKEIEENKKYKFNVWLLVLSFSFVLVSTIADGLDIYEKFMDKGIPDLWTTEFYLLILMFLVPIIALIVVVSRMIILLKK